MAEESKSQVPPSPEAGQPTTGQPIPPAPASAAPSDKPAAPTATEKPLAAEKPATPPEAAAPKPPAAPAAAAAPAAPKPAAPAKPAGPVPMPWTSPMVEKYKNQYGSALDAQSYLGQNYFTVDRSLIPDLLRLPARRRTLRLLRRRHRRSLSQARKAIRRLLDPLFVRAQRAHTRQNADRRRRVDPVLRPHLAHR